MKEKSKRMGFGLIFFGLIFFFNPNVTLFDIFPDVIGAFLIYLGLKKCAVVDGYFEDARKISVFISGVFALKFVLSFTLVGYSSNSLPYTFISGVLELIFVIPFFHKLYKGFEYTLMRNEDVDKDVLDLLNSAYISSIVLTVTKSVVTFLPEIFEFIKQSEDLDLSANAAYTRTISQIKPYAVALSIFIQLVVGILFLVQTKKFFSYIRKDKVYISSLSQKYENEYMANESKFAARELKTSMYMLIGAFVFSIDIYIDGIDYFPDFLAVVLIIISFAAIKSAKNIMLLVYSLTGTVYTLLSIYVRPEIFLQLTDSRNDKSTFFKSISGVYLYSAVCVVFFIFSVVILYKWINVHKEKYKKLRFGNRDRNLLTVFAFGVISFLSKALYGIFESVLAHLSYIEEVEKFISSRRGMTENMFKDAILQSENVALYTKLDSAATFFMYFAIIITVFAIFSVYALKQNALREEE